MENAREDLKSVERLNKQVDSTCKLRSYQVVPRWLIALIQALSQQGMRRTPRRKGAEPRAECRGFSDLTGQQERPE